MKCYADCPCHDSCNEIIENCPFPMYLATPSLMEENQVEQNEVNGLDFMSYVHLICVIGIVSFLIICFTLIFVYGGVK